MSLPQLALGVLDQQYHVNGCFLELADGRIMHAAGWQFTTSSDGGLTWSRPVEYKDAGGTPVGGSSLSLVRLSGGGIGLGAYLRGGETEEKRGLTPFLPPRRRCPAPSSGGPRTAARRGNAPWTWSWPA